MIDTIKVYSRDFEVGERSRLKLRPGIVDCHTGELENCYSLYRDRSGKLISGSGAYMNNNLFNLDINKNGLFLKFTPAKNYFGCNYYSITPDQLKLITTEIQRQLEDSDIYLNLDSSQLSRLDLAKNIHTDKPVSQYSELFGFLNGKRMRSVAYPQYFRYGNQSRQVVFYDKLEELSKYQKINLDQYDIPRQDTLRSELRFLTGKVIERDISFKTLSQLYDRSNYDYLKDRYKHHLKDLVFRSENKERLKLNITKEVEYLKHLKETSKRNAILEYLATTGIDRVLHMFGSLDNFRTILETAGFQREYTYRQIRQLQDRIKLRTRINLKYEKDSITQLYDELTKKLLN